MNKNYQSIWRIKEMNRKLFTLLSVLSGIALMLAACATATPYQPGATDVPTVQPASVTAENLPEAPKSTEVSMPTVEPLAGVSLPVVDPAAVTGPIITAGSSTVFPLAEAVATKFKEEGYKDQITIDSIGSGGGFERFCKTGETDISNASRKIKDAELQNCKTLGRTPIEFRVGTDAIAVVVSTENTFLTGVTKEELAKIFSKDAKKWSDIRPEWPTEDILRYSPGTDSGTFDYFVEAIMDPVYVKDATVDKGKGEEALLKAENLNLSEDDNVLVQGVEGSPYAIGYFGFAYFSENQGKLKAITINGIAPNEQTAESNEYPLSRPLFIYSDAQIMQSKPQVAAYINYFLSNVDSLIHDVGYFPASDEALMAAKQNWLDAMK
jgi:phosphate transport system substrate-binding protein